MKSLRKAARHVERQINRNLYKELEEQRLLIGRLLSNNVKRPKAVKSLKMPSLRSFPNGGKMESSNILLIYCLSRMTCSLSSAFKITERRIQGFC